MKIANILQFMDPFFCIKSQNRLFYGDFNGCAVGYLQKIKNFPAIVSDTNSKQLRSVSSALPETINAAVV